LFAQFACLFQVVFEGTQAAFVLDIRLQCPLVVHLEKKQVLWENGIGIDMILNGNRPQVPVLRDVEL